MDSRSSDRKIQLGVFGKPFGLEGYVYLRYHGNEPKGLLEFKELFRGNILLNSNKLYYCRQCIKNCLYSDDWPTR